MRPCLSDVLERAAVDSSDVREAGRTRTLITAGVALAVAASFLPVLWNGFVVWDDDLNLTENPYFRGFGPAPLRWMFTTFHGGHYQPITWLTFALDYTLWGMDARGYHLTSLVLHVANALLVYRLIAALVPDASPGSVAIGALVWAVHPLRAEVVAWATARRDVLAGFFYLLTVLTYLHATRAAVGTGERRRFLAASLAAFALSLLSKAQGMTLPAVLLVLDVYPLRRLGSGRAARAALVEKLPYLLVAMASAVVAFPASAEAARRSLAQHGLAARAAQAAYGLVFYLWKTVLPAGLSPVYPLGAGVDPTALVYVVAMLVALALTAGLVLLRRRAPWALAAWLCYLAVLAPVLGFAQAGPQLVADRYTYLASVPLATLVTTGLQALRAPALRRAVGVVLVLFALATARQVSVWHDSRTLWSHAIRVDPRNYVAYTNRGKVLELAGDTAGAFADYNAAIASYPANFLAHYSRGRLRQAAGDLDGAIEDYSATIAVQPTYAEAYNNRGAARVARNDLVGAADDFAAALRVAPPDWSGRKMVEGNLARVQQALRGSVAP